MIYFTADTHFGNKRTLEFSKRPFQDVSEMDFILSENWNKTVNNSDTVYHLGDFGNYKWVRSLKGTKILVMGNYEIDDLNKNFSGDFNKYEATLQLLGFSKVIYSRIWTINDLLDTDEPINLTHCPNDCIKTGIFNLFGHVHKLCMIKRYGLNVGTDCHDFKPIDINTVLFYKNAIENHYDENVFE